MDSQPETGIYDSVYDYFVFPQNFVRAALSSTYSLLDAYPLGLFSRLGIVIFFFLREMLGAIPQ